MVAITNFSAKMSGHLVRNKQFSPQTILGFEILMHSKVILSSKKDSSQSLLLSETKLSVENFSGEQRARLNSLQSNSPLPLIVLGVKSSAERGG